MPIRHAITYKQLGNEPRTEVYNGSIGKARAHLRHEMTQLLRDGYRIASDNDDSASMALGDEFVYIFIVANPVVHRAAGGGRPALSEGEATVRRNIFLIASDLARLEEIGDGNVSLAVRRLLERE